jgi:hypothetical protein
MVDRLDVWCGRAATKMSLNVSNDDIRVLTPVLRGASLCSNQASETVHFIHNQLLHSIDGILVFEAEVELLHQAGSRVKARHHQLTNGER